jgi:hypothetical protein
MTRKIKVTSEQLEEMYEQSQEKEYLSVKGFEGWSFYLDEEDCEYDREHGAQVDFLMTLTSPDGDEYQGREGYENECVSMCFNHDVHFEEVSKTIPIKNKKIRFSVNMTLDFTLDESVEDTEINKTAVEAMFNAYLQHNLKEVKVFRSNYEF